MQDQKPKTDELALAYAKLAELVDHYAQHCVNSAFGGMCQRLIVALKADDEPDIFKKGEVTHWACGVAHAVGWANFLSDPQHNLHIRPIDMAQWFGVAQSKMHTYSASIRKKLDITRLDPRWILPGSRRHPSPQKASPTLTPLPKLPVQSKLTAFAQSFLEDVEQGANAVQTQGVPGVRGARVDFDVENPNVLARIVPLS